MQQRNNNHPSSSSWSPYEQQAEPNSSASITSSQRKSSGGGVSQFNPFCHSGQGNFHDPYDRNSISAPKSQASVISDTSFIPMKPSRSTAPLESSVIRTAGTYDSEPPRNFYNGNQSEIRQQPWEQTSTVPGLNYQPIDHKTNLYGTSTSQQSIPHAQDESFKTSLYGSQSARGRGGGNDHPHAQDQSSKTSLFGSQNAIGQSHGGIAQHSSSSRTSLYGTEQTGGSSQAATRVSNPPGGRSQISFG